MKALFLQTIGNSSLSEAEKPLPRPDELLVRIEARGICGTDRHLFKGEFPCRPPICRDRGIVDPRRLSRQSWRNREESQRSREVAFGKGGPVTSSRSLMPSPRYRYGGVFC